MSTHAKIGLDNPAFSGRLRNRSASPMRVEPRTVKSSTPKASLIGSVKEQPSSTATTIRPVYEKPLQSDIPAPTPHHEYDNKSTFKGHWSNNKSELSEVASNSNVLIKQLPESDDNSPFVEQFEEKVLVHSRPHTLLQKTLFGMAVIVFSFGMAVSISTMQTNNKANSQVSALSAQADKQATTSDAGDVAVPSTNKPNVNAYANYVVAPELARYIKIPKLGIDARVLQVGVKANGEIATPNNVHDTAWYSGSAKPGQPGATVINGHVSSWTSRGVFYNVKNLVAGDTIQIQKGDNAIVSYKVVKSQVYDADKVDMQAAIQPVTPGKSGLNLITCAGQVKKGTNEFTQRLVVFAEQV